MIWLDKIVKSLRSEIRQSPWSKYNLRRIKGITQSEIDRFSSAGLPDQKSLQERLDGYAGLAFGKLQSSTHLQRTRLLALLEESLKLWSNPSLFRRAWCHWADVLLFAVVILLAAEVFSPPERAHHVIAAREIPPFQKIQPDDLKEGPSKDGSRETTKQYLGNYTVSSVHQGNALSSSSLSPGLTLLRIEVKNSAVPDKAILPLAVLLVFSSRKPPAVGTTIPAMLTKIEASEGAQIASLQIPFAEQAKVAKWLGAADAYIMLPAP
jgi:hypothetical protein